MVASIPLLRGKNTRGIPLMSVHLENIRDKWEVWIGMCTMDICHDIVSHSPSGVSAGWH